MSRDVVFQLSAFPHAEVTSPIGSARRLLEHGLNLNKSALVKHRVMIFPHVIDEIPLIVIIWVILCVAKPCYPVVLAVVLVPFVSVAEELIAKVAILVRADVRLKIFQDMLPEMR